MSPRARRALGAGGAIGITLIVGILPTTAFVRAGATPSAVSDMEAAATASQPAERRAPPEPEPSEATRKSTDAVDLTNQRRIAAGLPRVSIDPALTAAALQHAQDQASRGVMTHTGWDGSDPGQRIARNGGSFSTWGENVAAGYTSAASVVNAWMNSPGHRRNILGGSFTRIGIGAAQASDGTWFWTMVLAG